MRKEAIEPPFASKLATVNIFMPSIWFPKSIGPGNGGVEGSDVVIGSGSGIGICSLFCILLELPLSSNGER